MGHENDITQQNDVTKHSTPKNTAKVLKYDMTISHSKVIRRSTKYNTA